MADPRELGLVELGGGAKHDVFAGEERDEALVPAAILVVDERVGVGVDEFELLAGREAVEAEIAGAGIGLLDEAGDANFEKLVEIGTDDGEELDALEERTAGVFGLFEHTAVEGQPALFAIGVKVSSAGIAGGPGDRLAGGTADFRGSFGTFHEKGMEKTIREPPDETSGLGAATAMLHEREKEATHAGTGSPSRFVT